MASGIKDKVAIVGMGCTTFKEHWDKGADDLMIDATSEAFASAGGNLIDTADECDHFHNAQYSSPSQESNAVHIADGTGK